MRKMRVPVIAIAAAAGGGKSKLLETLHLVTQGDPRILILDTSKVIDWHRAEGTKLGVLFDGLLDDQSKRKLMPDKPTIHAGIQRIRQHMRDGTRKNYKVLLTIWAGVPRKFTQAKLLYKAFEHLYLTTIECSLDEALRGDAERPARIDSGPDKTKLAYNLHQDLAVPGIQYLIERKRIPHLPLERRQPMAKKIKALIEFGPLDPELAALLKARCTDPNHPACQFIHELDGTHPPKAAYSATTVTNNAQVSDQQPEYPFVPSKRAFAGALPGQVMAPQ